MKKPVNLIWRIFFPGMVLFLEEDHYVAEDFIHILRLMEKTGKASCPACNILSLGTYLKTYNYYGDSKKVRVVKNKMFIDINDLFKILCNYNMS